MVIPQSKRAFTVSVNRFFVIFELVDPSKSINISLKSPKNQRYSDDSTESRSQSIQSNLYRWDLETISKNNQGLFQKKKKNKKKAINENNGLEKFSGREQRYTSLCENYYSGLVGECSDITKL